MLRFNKRGEIINDGDIQRTAQTNLPSSVVTHRQESNPLHYLFIGFGVIAILACIGVIFGGALGCWITSSFLQQPNTALPKSDQGFSKNVIYPSPTVIVNTFQEIVPTTTRRPIALPSSTPRSLQLIPTATNAPRRNAQISYEVEKVNLRRSPGYINKSTSDVIIKIPKGATVEIINGPQYADELNWWYISWNGYEGWVANHTHQGLTILVFEP